jgi:hypothetical protein
MKALCMVVRIKKQKQTKLWFDFYLTAAYNTGKAELTLPYYFVRFLCSISGI